MPINLNRTQPRSAKKFCRSTSERRADWAERLISNIDNGRPYCDSFGNANSYNAATSGQGQAEELQDFSLEAVMQHREDYDFAPLAQTEAGQMATWAPEVLPETGAGAGELVLDSGDDFDDAQPDLSGDNALAAAEIEAADSDARAEQFKPQTFNHAERAQAAEGIMRTTEFLRQPNGTFIRPHYNRSGILTSVDFSDGCRFFRADAKSPWLVLDQCSKAVEGIDITSVSIDPRGNVVYIVGGEKSVIHIDGVMQ